MERIIARHRNTVFIPLLLLAMRLRVLDLGQRSLWFDEAVEYLTARAPLQELFGSVLSLNLQPPLFALLLHLWLRISLHPIWLRLLPVCLSMLTLAVIIRWSYARGGSRVALLAGLIMAVMPTEIYYAQDVGEYPLLFLLITSSLYLLDTARRKPSWLNWLGWGIFTTAAIYTHYGAIIILSTAAAVTMVESIWQRRRAVWRRQLLVGLGTILSVLPLLIYFLPSQINRRGNSGWHTYAFPGLAATASRFAELLYMTFMYNFSGWTLSEVPTAPATTILFVLAVLIMFNVRQLPLNWLLSAGIGLVLYFVLVQLGLYIGGFRYGLIFTPFLVLFTALALDAVWEKQAVLAILPLVLLLSVEVYGLPNPTLSAWIREQQSWQPREQMAQSFAYWQAQRQPNDKTFVYYGAVPAFHYYLQATGVDEEQTRRRVMCDTGETYSTCQEYQLFYSRWNRSLSSEEKVEALFDLLGERPERLWIIFSHVHQEEDSQILETLTPAYEVSQRSNAGPEAALLLVRTR